MCTFGWYLPSEATHFGKRADYTDTQIRVRGGGPKYVAHGNSSSHTHGMRRGNGWRAQRQLIAQHTHRDVQTERLTDGTRAKWVLSAAERRNGL